MARRYYDTLKRIRYFLRRQIPERTYVSWLVLRLIWSREYSKALRVVRSVATDTGFYQQSIAGHSAAEENLLRMSEARDRMSKPTSRKQNAMLEIAYISYTERG